MSDIVRKNEREEARAGTPDEPAERPKRVKVRPNFVSAELPAYTGLSITISLGRVAAWLILLTNLVGSAALFLMDTAGMLAAIALALSGVLAFTLISALVSLLSVVRDIGDASLRTAEAVEYLARNLND